MAFNHAYKNKIYWALLVILVLRLLAMWLIPLTDTTEARYGEIARKMLETDNWITPQFDYGIPFWAKPPLSTWVSAFSMKLFGVNEFASRLPSLLSCLGLLFIVYRWLTKIRPEIALLSVVVLSTSFLFFGSSGLVMTDLCLIFASTLAMIAFWQSLQQNENKYWGYLFFVGLGIGLLAKGPLILVLVGLPTGLWTLFQRQLKNVWIRLPWITGTLLTLAIAAPWYWIAEQRTPGFLQYFIIGEHINRFLVSGWTGDRYGHAHSEPLGMIWVYLILGFMPWIGLVATLLIKHRKNLSWRPLFSNTWFNYLLLWSIMPVIFFTFAHNIIPPYALPAMPACAVLIAEFFNSFNIKENQFNQKNIFHLSILIPVLSIVVLIIFAFNPQMSQKRSENKLVYKYFELRDNERSQLVYYKNRLYSAEFYSKGKSKIAKNINELSELTTNDTTDFVAIHKDYLDASTSTFLAEHFTKIETYHGISLYRECDIHHQSQCGR